MEQKDYLKAALCKWADGVDLSMYEFGLIMDLMENGSISVDMPDQGAAMGAQSRFVGILEQWANNMKQQGKRG